MWMRNLEMFKVSIYCPGILLLKVMLPLCDFIVSLQGNMSAYCFNERQIIQYDMVNWLQCGLCYFGKKC